MRTNNYFLQAKQAQQAFLRYDQRRLLQKLSIKADEGYFYPVLFSKEYRLNRTDGTLERRGKDGWEDANTHPEVMTILDFICDSREDRHPAHVWKNMAAFGMQFHQNLLEGQRDVWAEAFEAKQADFCRACRELGGRPLTIGDISFAIPVFEDLEAAVQLWRSDEEFPASLRVLWDENALQYLKYETMYFARDLLLRQIQHHMDHPNV